MGGQVIYRSVMEDCYVLIACIVHTRTIFITRLLSGRSFRKKWISIDVSSCLVHNIVFSCNMQEAASFQETVFDIVVDAFSAGFVCCLVFSSVRIDT